MTQSDNPPIYTRSFWAKAYPYRQRGPERIHLLEHHLADVGACFEALLAQPTIRQRLAHAGGIDCLKEATAARLCVFAALHDIGKVNVGFQTQVWRDEDFPTGDKPRRAGHDRDMTPVLDNEKNTPDWFFDALGWWWDATESWDDREGETVCALFVATLSHHGTPIQLDSSKQGNPRIWRRLGQLEPRQGVERIGRLAREWFPSAFATDAPPLPSAPAFQHMFLGLCTLADWIGSNEDWFPYSDEPRDDYIETARGNARRAVSEVGLDVSEQRLSMRALPGFGSLFPHIGDAPNAIQKAAALDAPLEEPLVIIESETGSGKTEAALWRFARMYQTGLVDGLYFALPTRAAASQLHQRVNGFVKAMFTDGGSPEAVLAIPGYVKAGDITGNRLQDYVVWWDDHAEGAAAQRRWAAESSKRYLAAQIAVGTVDQAMMAALKVKHAHMRAACLARNLLVVDEVHASDPYMRVILEALLNAHLGAGGYALLMSATLGSAARRLWLFRPRRESQVQAMSLDDAIQAPYPAVTTRAGHVESVLSSGENDLSKDVCIEAQPAMSDPAQVAERALEAARAGAKVLVIRNTVAYAVAAQQAIEAASSQGESGLLFSLNGVRTLHTGRFAAGDRKLLDDEVEAQIGKERAAGGRIVVGTQTLEQSLDIDADLLITDLCPVDVLLQRIGRLHRHRRDDRPDGYRTPACVVLTPGDDLSTLLTSPINGLGRYVYQDLRVLVATLRLIDAHAEWSIPRMNRELVERATHPDALEAIVRELGDAWRIHANSITGENIAEGLTAASSIIRRDKSFFEDNRDVVFRDMEERIRTRLGDEGIEVALEPPPSSPFDGSFRIEKLAVPARWLRGVEVPESVSPMPTDGGFTFSVGDRRFTYDRLGLRGN